MRTPKRSVRTAINALAVVLIFGPMFCGDSVDAVARRVVTFTPASLPTLTVGVPADIQLTATAPWNNPTCDIGLYPCANFNTAGEIAGLSFFNAFYMSAGSLVGTPTTAGPYSITYSGCECTDISHTVCTTNCGSKTYTGVVNAAVPTIPVWMLIGLASILIGLALLRLSGARPSASL